MARTIRDVEDVLALLDTLFPQAEDRWTAEGADWWDRFYADRDRGIPFFVDKPDESLATWLDRDRPRPARALDLGCGPGRNALHLAAAGWTVDAVDLSPAAIAWAGERAAAAGLDVRFVTGDAFVADLPGPYDLVVDSGCFHHLPPHRRISHLALLERVLAPGGLLSLTCFDQAREDHGGGGTDMPDAELYRSAWMPTGIGYTDADLRWIFAGYEEIELRRMRAHGPVSPLFGEAFLWTALLRRPVRQA
jgi:SAM-dependent methyltransferase